jgi:hypothetical protein
MVDTMGRAGKMGQPVWAIPKKPVLYQGLGLKKCSKIEIHAYWVRPDRLF